MAWRFQTRNVFRLRPVRVLTACIPDGTDSREKMVMGTPAAASTQPTDPFAVDEDRALAELELAWSDGGYHGFTVEGDTWGAVSSAGEVLTGRTPDALNRAIRAHWQALRG